MSGVHLPAPFNAVAYCRAGVVGHVHHFDALSSDDVVASVCCPANCGRCGGVDCWTQPGGEDCCARHVYDRKVPCLNEGDVGCVLPLAAAERLPFSQRDTECVTVEKSGFGACTVLCSNFNQIVCDTGKRAAASKLPSPAASLGRMVEVMSSSVSALSSS